MVVVVAVVNLTKWTTEKLIETIIIMIITMSERSHQIINNNY